MLFKNTFEPIPALQFVYKNLQLTSTLGRHYLLDLPFCTDADTLRAEFDLMEATAAIVHDDTHRTKLSHLRNQLHQINDIRPTLSVLESGQVLDDIQLFEIKKTAILTGAIANDLAAIQCPLFPLEGMEEVVACLDPEHTHIPHFYIYSAYDPELAKWRERIQNAQSVQEAEEFRFQAQKVEDKVRAHLTEQLQPWREAIARSPRCDWPATGTAAVPRWPTTPSWCSSPTPRWPLPSPKRAATSNPSTYTSAAKPSW